MIRLVLQALSPSIGRSEKPSFKVSLRNEGDTPKRICTYMLHQRLLGGLSATDADGVEYALYPFTKGRWMKFKPSDVRTLGSKRALTDELALANEPNWGLVRTGSQPPILTRDYVLPELPTGVMEFSTFLADRVSLYVGRDAVNDFSWSQRVIPDDVPHADVDFSDVDQTLIHAAASVTIV